MQNEKEVREIINSHIPYKFDYSKGAYSDQYRTPYLFIVVSTKTSLVQCIEMRYEY